MSDKVFKFFNPSMRCHMQGFGITLIQGHCETDDPDMCRVILKTPGALEFDPKSALNLLSLEEIQSYGYLKEPEKEKKEAKPTEIKLPEVQVIKKADRKIPDFPVMTLYELKKHAEEMDVVLKNGWKKDQIVDALIKKAKEKKAND
jgi:hypothetical protein